MPYSRSSHRWECRITNNWERPKWVVGAGGMRGSILSNTAKRAKPCAQEQGKASCPKWQRFSDCQCFNSRQDTRAPSSHLQQQPIPYIRHILHLLDRGKPVCQPGTAPITMPDFRGFSTEARGAVGGVRYTVATTSSVPKPPDTRRLPRAKSSGRIAWYLSGYRCLIKHARGAKDTIETRSCLGTLRRWGSCFLSELE